MLQRAAYNVESILFAVLVFFTLTFFIYNDFSIRMIWGYGFLVCCLCLYIFLMNSKIKVTKNKCLFLFFSLSIAVFIVSPIAKLEQGSFYLLATVVLGSLYVFFGKLKSKDFQLISKFISFSAVLLSLYVIGVSIWPDLYYSYVAHHLSGDSQNVVRELLNTGYGVAIGGDVVIIDYVLILALFIQLGRVIVILKAGGAVKWSQVLPILLFLIAIVFENRKSELFSTLIIIFYMVFNYGNYKLSSLNYKKIIIFFLVLAMIIFLSFSFGDLDYNSFVGRYVLFFNLLMDLFMASQRLNIDISSGRLVLWESAFQLFLDNPIIGIGWGNFSNFITFTFNNLNEGQLHNVHNNYLQILCENGVIGFFFLVVPLFLIFNSTLKKAKVVDLNHMDNECEVAVLASVAFQACFLIISFIDPCWYKMVFWSFYSIVLMMSDIIPDNDVCC